MQSNIGEWAALAVSLFFSGSSTFFTVAAQRYGAMMANRLRLPFALLLVMALHWVVYGSPLPLGSTGTQWFWMGLSGLVGFVLGDICLLSGYVYVGARLTMLMMSLAPVIATITGWIFLGDSLAGWDLFGVALTVSGIMWVVLERSRRVQGVRDPQYFKGILFGMGAATGQALGLVLSKQGLSGGLPPISGNIMRLVAATIAIWLLTLVQGQSRLTIRRFIEQPQALGYLIIGILCGPVVGVSLSLFAVQHANVGIASTLMALPPVILLPVGHFFFKEHISWQAIAGTLVAIAGVALIFLV